jgi:glyoxylase-like metal-dependent hydrolase (beta-lactamase superfamily II)
MAEAADPVSAIIRLVDLPAGVAGPEPVSFEVRCFVVPSGSGIALVDAALPGTVGEIERSIAGLGGSWSDVVDVIVTHGHFDHVAGLAELVGRCPTARLWAGVDDLAEVENASGRAVQAAVDLDRIGDLTVLETPGHTAGHISLLHETASLLLIGDLVGVQRGQLDFGPPAFTADPDRNRASLARVVELGVDRILFSHGPEISQPSDQIRTFLAAS